MKKLRTNRLVKLLVFTKPWWLLYTIGLIGVSSQSLAFNYTMALGLKGLTQATVQKDLSALVGTLMVLALRLLFLMAIIPLLSYAFERSVKMTTGNIRKHLFNHIQRLPMKYIEDQHSGDLVSRLTNDIQRAENAYGNQLNVLLMAVISGIGSTIVIFNVNWKMALIAVVLGLANTLVNALFIKPLKKSSDEAQRALSQSTQRLSDILAGSYVIRIFNLTKNVMLKYQEANDGIRKWSMRRVVQNSYLSGLNMFIIMMSFIGMIVIGSMMIIRKSLDFGSLLLITQMMNGIIWMFSALGNFITQLQASLAGADRIFEILNIPEEALTASPGIDGKEAWKKQKYHSQAAHGEAVIAFHEVSFSYDNKSNVLERLNLQVYRDEVVAVVGSSGSGKSTLFKLLLGFYTGNSGSIQLFGRNLQGYSLEELRQLIGYVPQDNYLFSGSIRENIAYGKPDASEDEIITAAKAAYAHEFILELSAGYETQVGERGGYLSGGQRQRIAIARALLKDAPILLLDEATSSLDSESEQQVQKALEGLMKGRTTMVVAHRLSTIQYADRILVLENGKVAEEGNHDSLMMAGNGYARLYALQFKDDVKKEAMV